MAMSGVIGLIITGKDQTKANPLAEGIVKIH